MEDAVEALKMAFAVMVLVLGISVAIPAFSRLIGISKVVTASSDVTQIYNYEDFVADFDSRNRVVGLETIIPTLYKYYKENYTVVFLNTDGTPLPLYQSHTPVNLWGEGEERYKGTIGKYYTSSTDRSEWAKFDNKPVCSFDVDEEVVRNEQWTSTQQDAKKNIDAFLSGKTVDYNFNIGGIGKIEYKYGEFFPAGSFMSQYGKSKFKEMVGEYKYTRNEGDEYDASDVNTTKKNKRVIIYQLT